MMMACSLDCAKVVLVDERLLFHKIAAELFQIFADLRNFSDASGPRIELGLRHRQRNSPCILEDRTTGKSKYSCSIPDLDLRLSLSQP